MRKSSRTRECSIVSSRIVFILGHDVKRYHVNFPGDSSYSSANKNHAVIGNLSGEEARSEKK